MLELHLVVPGDGAVETTLPVYLKNLARILVGGAGRVVSSFVSNEFCLHCVENGCQLRVEWRLGGMGAKWVEGGRKIEIIM